MFLILIVISGLALFGGGVIVGAAGVLLLPYLAIRRRVCG